MDDLISRKALLDEILDLLDETDENISIMPEVVALIRHAPAADVAPVRHGRWIGIEYDGYADGYPVYDLWECSECGEEVRGEDVPETHPWCHGCGAEMDGNQMKIGLIDVDGHSWPNL